MAADTGGSRDGPARPTAPAAPHRPAAPAPARPGRGPRPRHVPQRTCVACRQPRGKRELVRVVRTTSGAVRVDPTGKQSGRGAYLCQAPECWRSALQRGILPRALKIDVVPPDDLQTLTDYAGRLGP